MNLYKFNKKLTVAREKAFIFIQINNFKMKIYSNLSNTNKHCYLKLQIPLMHFQFFKTLSQTLEYVQTHCIDRNPFHFASSRCYLCNNLQC